MTTPSEKPKKTEVVKLTAVANPEPLAPWPTQQKVTLLAELLDWKYPRYQEILKSLEQLEKVANLPANSSTRKQTLKEAEKVIENFEKRGGPNSVKDGRLLKRWEACCPKGWWPEDEDCDGPARSEVAKMIAFLMGSFPTEKIPQPKVFVKVLLDDVMALNPDFLEMEATCRILRTTKTFMPSISEVIEELKKQKKLWNQRNDVAENLEDYYNELRGAIDCAKGAEQAIAERKAAKAQPLVVGDRVRNPKLGAGTVIAVEQIIPEIGRYRVRFDADVSRTVYGSGLERLIPGDEGFEPPAVPMIEHRNTTPMAPIDTPDTVEAVPTKEEEQDDEF